MSGPRRLLAARAGIGIATLYRRFPPASNSLPPRSSRRSARMPRPPSRPWQSRIHGPGFSGFVERICELQAGDRGLADLLSMTLPAGKHVERVRRLANDRVVELVERAKAVG